MLVKKENCNAQIRYLDTSFAPKERVVFFDIETTGLRAGSSSLYLIGMLSYEAEGWTLTQYFAQTPSGEKEVLAAFSAYLKERLRTEDHLILVTFNGDGFDIPYLRALSEQYRMPDPFYGCVSFDLYKAVKPLKRLLHLTDCKLKTVEKEVFGIQREDPYNGGELIYVYEEYVRLERMLKGGCEDTPQNKKLKEKLLQCLLLHNGEDVKDMSAVLGITAYQALTEGAFTLQKAELVTDAAKRQILDLRFSLQHPLAGELFLENDIMTVSAGGKDPTLLELTVPLCSRRLRYFYPDYKNYYYLPAEDEAVHKSLGTYVDRSNRKQATPQTCYTWKEGTFFPLPGPLPAMEPYFYPVWHGTPHAFFEERILSDEDRLKALAVAALESFRTAKPLPKS